MFLSSQVLDIRNKCFPISKLITCDMWNCFLDIWRKLYSIMDIRNTFSDIRNCFPDIHNNYLKYMENWTKILVAKKEAKSLLSETFPELKMSIKNRHATFTTQRAAAVQVLRKLTEVDKNCKKNPNSVTLSSLNLAPMERHVRLLISG